jgi:hypothetical protein
MYKIILKGSGGEGLPNIYEEMHKYLTIYMKAVVIYDFLPDPF